MVKAKIKALTSDERRTLGDIEDAMRQLADYPIHVTHPFTEPDDCQVLIDGCPRCEAIAVVWVNATDWIPFLLKRTKR